MFCLIGCGAKIQFIEINNRLTDCLLLVCKSVFSPSDTLHFIYENHSTNLLLPNISNPFLVDFLDEPIRKSLDYNNYIVFINNRGSIKSTLNKLTKSPIWDPSKSPRGRYLIITNSNMFLDQFIKSFWSYGIRNIIMVVANSKSHPLLYTSNPFNLKSKCAAKVQVNLVQQCKGNVKVTFYKTLKSLKGCKIRLEAAFQLRNDTSIGFHLIIGIIEDIVYLMGDVLKTKVTSFNKEPNALVDYKKDIIMEGCPIKLLEAYQHYEVSDTFYYDDMVWIAPKILRNRNFTLLLSVFDTVTWQLIFVVFVIVVLLWWMIAKRKEDVIFRKISRSMLIVTTLTLGSGSHVLPETKLLRMLMMFYLIYIIHILNPLVSVLITISTNPMAARSITSIDDLLQLNLPIFVNEVVKDVNLNQTQKPLLVELKKQMVVTNPVNHTFNEYQVIHHQNCSTFIGKTLLFKIYEAQKHVSIIDNSGLNPMETNVLMKKGHYFFDTFNHFKKRITEIGIIQKILTDIRLHYHKAFYKHIDTKHSPLKLKNCFGMFIWWLGGLLFANVAFLSELIYWNLIKRKHPDV